MLYDVNLNINDKINKCLTFGKAVTIDCNPDRLVLCATTKNDIG